MCEGDFMTNGMNIGITGFKQNSYGNIQRIGATENGRTIYRVIDSEGKEAGRLSVASADTDKFESAYKDIMDAAPKIQKYVAENSSDADIKKRRNLSRLIVGVAGITGAGIGYSLARKASVLQQILTTTTGIVAGLSAGFVAALSATTPPGSYKFAKATRTFSKLDIQPMNNDIKS